MQKTKFETYEDFGESGIKSTVWKNPLYWSTLSQPLFEDMEP